MDDSSPLSEFEHELLELCSMAGETTTTLDEEMLESSPGRVAVEAALRRLLARGLLTTERGTYAGVQRNRDGRSFDRVYDDDWWDVTPAGRAAVGLPDKPPGRDSN